MAEPGLIHYITIPYLKKCFLNKLYDNVFSGTYYKKKTKEKIISILTPCVVFHSNILPEHTHLTFNHFKF